MQTRPFNINPCRCRCPNLHNPLRSVVRSFSSSDMDLPGQREFFKKNYKICDQKKLFGDPRTIWKTYQKIQHSLRHVLSVTNDQLDFSISVGKGRADSSEIGLLDYVVTFPPKKSWGKKSKFSRFFQSWKQKRQVFHPKPRQNFESPDSPCPCLWNLQNSLGLQGDNLVGWFPGRLFWNKGISFKENPWRMDVYEWNKAFVWMDGKAFLFGWMLLINETKHLFGWIVHREAKHFCLRMWFWSLFSTETTSLVLLYPKCIQLCPNKKQGLHCRKLPPPGLGWNSGLG